MVGKFHLAFPLAQSVQRGQKCFPRGGQAVFHLWGNLLILLPVQQPVRAEVLEALAEHHIRDAGYRTFDLPIAVAFPIL